MAASRPQSWDHRWTSPAGTHPGTSVEVSLLALPGCRWAVRPVGIDQCDPRSHQNAACSARDCGRGARGRHRVRPDPARCHRGCRPPQLAASAVGVNRIWRDSGHAIGALIAGITADVVGLRGAILTIAALTAASGLLAARLLTETHTVGETTMARTKVSHPLFARFYAWASPRMEKAGYGERRGQLLAGLTGECSRWVRTTARTSLTTPAEVIAVLAVEPEPHLSLPRSPRSVVSEAWRRAAVLRARPGRYRRLGRVQRVLDATVWPTVGAGCHAHRDTTMKEG
jgi:hypothetical protein